MKQILISFVAVVLGITAMGSCAKDTHHSQFTERYNFGVNGEETVDNKWNNVKKRTFASSWGRRTPCPNGQPGHEPNCDR